MNQQFKDIDFKNNIFEYPDLTQIIGEPSTATLITLRGEAKAHTQAVHSTLGRGEHGYSALYVDLSHTLPGTGQHPIYQATRSWKTYNQSHWNAISNCSAPVWACRSSLDVPRILRSGKGIAATNCCINWTQIPQGPKKFGHKQDYRVHSRHFRLSLRIQTVFLYIRKHSQC